MSAARAPLTGSREAGGRRARPILVRAVQRVAGLVRARLAHDEPVRQRRTNVPLIGLDVSRPPIRLRTRSWAPLAAAALAGALLLAVLRVDVIRIRFGLAESLAEELRLEDLKRQLTVEMRRLRDPAVLSRRARELGFQRAERMIDLPADGTPQHLPEPPAVVGPVEFAAAVPPSRERRR